MAFKDMNPIVRALLSGAVMVPIILLIDYVVDVMIRHQTFSPDWFQIILCAVLVGVLTYFGPDAAQRRKNRQDLKNKLTGKR